MHRHYYLFSISNIGIYCDISISSVSIIQLAKEISFNGSQFSFNAAFTEQKSKSYSLKWHYFYLSRRLSIDCCPHDVLSDKDHWSSGHRFCFGKNVHCNKVIFICMVKVTILLISNENESINWLLNHVLFHNLMYLE